jgi:hypothetical protein
MHLGGSPEYQFAVASSREMMRIFGEGIFIVAG